MHLNLFPGMDFLCGFHWFLDGIFGLGIVLVNYPFLVSIKTAGCCQKCMSKPTKWELVYFNQQVYCCFQTPFSTFDIKHLLWQSNLLFFFGRTSLPACRSSETENEAENVSWQMLAVFLGISYEHLTLKGTSMHLTLKRLSLRKKDKTGQG